jgi:hypothetical protein
VSAAQVKDKVQRILTESFGSASIDKDGDFFTRFESALVYIRVIELKSEISVVKTWAIMISQAQPTPELYKWAATEGQSYFFGHSRVVEGEDGLVDIVFEHTLLGDFLDPEELNWAVVALGQSANDLDDQLQARFGGKRFIEE